MLHTAIFPNMHTGAVFSEMKNSVSSEQAQQASKDYGSSEGIVQSRTGAPVHCKSSLLETILRTQAISSLKQ